MAKKIDFSDFFDDVLVDDVVYRLMPNIDVPDGTKADYSIGACLILRNLTYGDWDSERFSEFDKGLIAEFLGRVISNSERLGIEYIYPRKSES